jgi:hypothetical protein
MRRRFPRLGVVIINGSARGGGDNQLKLWILLLALIAAILALLATRPDLMDALKTMVLAWLAHK